MTTERSLRFALEREISKWIRRHAAVLGKARRERRRFEKRTGLSAQMPLNSLPRQWGVDAHFNPYHVRSRAESILHAVKAKIAARAYRPKPSLIVSIPKPGGGHREISILTIPDSAVSFWLSNRLINRNTHLYSSYSYAYRSDRNAHHALTNLMRDIRGRRRVYALEYDFTKYFDNIDHQYLRVVLKQHFLISARELALVDALLTASFARGATAYASAEFVRRTRGIPQGSNLSLFLANVACYELDREIEKTGASFARFADDTLVICDTYETANQCARLMLEHGRRSGTEINFTKSSGISLLTNDPGAELRAKPSLTFLGHSLSADGIAIAPRGLGRIKRRLARIVYDNLLLQPKREQMASSRVGAAFHDWDLVNCVNELRKYIYGGMSETHVTDALEGREQPRMMRGAMSFYPTLDPAAASDLREMDGWLADIVTRAYSRRVRLLAQLGIASNVIDQERMITGEWYQFNDQIKNETRLPSFVKSWFYVRKCRRVFGLAPFPTPQYGYA